MRENEMFVPRKAEAEVAEVMQMLNGMSEAEQQKMLVFLDGVAFGRRLSEKRRGRPGGVKERSKGR